MCVCKAVGECRVRRATTDTYGQQKGKKKANGLAFLMGSGNWDTRRREKKQKQWW